MVLLFTSQTYSSTEFVFFEYSNQTGFSSMGYVALIGLLTISFSFSGYESGASLAEETQSASISAPKGIVMACVMTAIVGFIYVVGLLYAMQENIEFALNGSASSLAACNIFYIAFTHTDMSSNGIAYTHTNINAVMIVYALLAVSIYFSGFSGMTLISRVGYALARDGALPGSKWLSQIDEESKTPARMIFLIFILASCLNLLILVNETAFVALTSVSAIGY